MGTDYDDLEIIQCEVQSTFLKLRKALKEKAVSYRNNAPISSTVTRTLDRAQVLDDIGDAIGKVMGVE